MNPTGAISWVCSNHEIVDPLVIWAAGMIPASAIAWIIQRWKLLPPWAIRLIQIVAGNLLHAAAGEPVQPQENPK